MPISKHPISGKFPAARLTGLWVIVKHWWIWPRWSYSLYGKGSYLFVNMTDKISLLLLCRTRYEFQTRPGTYLEAGILSEAYLPLFHVNPWWQIGQEFLWSLNCCKVETFFLFLAWKTIIFAPLVTEIQRMNLRM